MNMCVNDSKFEVSQNDYVDVLLEGYESQKNNLIAFHEAVNQTSLLNTGLVKNFSSTLPTLEQTQHLLNVHFWGEVYSRSNISTYLDTEKRNKWANDLHVHANNKAVLPEFNRENIIATLNNWYESRTELFIDRVDHLFKSLSKTHITNEPQGFSKKMIFTYSCDSIFSSPNDMRLNENIKDILFDLAGVIATVLNIPVPTYGFKNSFKSLETGKKTAFFGDTFELQVFKNGNAHVWIHPQIAIDLNLWLAKRYPSAIATENRTKPKKIQEFSYSYDYLTSADFDLLVQIQGNCGMNSTLNNLSNSASDRLKAAERFAKFAGISVHEISNFVRGHGYDRLATEILRNGYPNIKDHQFYATPEEITDSISEHLASNYEEETLNAMLMLEPSAGTGKLALLHPCYPLKSHCVEVSPFFSKVLLAKGLHVENIDFMKFKPEHAYDLVIMNPPYKSKQLETHLAKALTHLKNGAELIAVVPCGKVAQISQMAGFEGLTVLSKHSAAFEDTRIETAVISVYA